MSDSPSPGGSPFSRLFNNLDAAYTIAEELRAESHQDQVVLHSNSINHNGYNTAESDMEPWRGDLVQAIAIFNRDWADKIPRPVAQEIWKKWEESWRACTVFVEMRPQDREAYFEGFGYRRGTWSTASPASTSSWSFSPQSPTASPSTSTALVRRPDDVLPGFQGLRLGSIRLREEERPPVADPGRGMGLFGGLETNGYYGSFGSGGQAAQVALERQNRAREGNNTTYGTWGGDRSEGNTSYGTWGGTGSF